MERKNDFSKGSIVGNILKLALPMTLAQLINVLYNIVDRIYIGMIPENATLSSRGWACASHHLHRHRVREPVWHGRRAALLHRARPGKRGEEAEAIMGNSFILMLITGAILTVLGLAVRRPMLFLFGASPDTIIYAETTSPSIFWETSS